MPVWTGGGGNCRWEASDGTIVLVRRQEGSGGVSLITEYSQGIAEIPGISDCSVLYRLEVTLE